MTSAVLHAVPVMSVVDKMRKLRDGGSTASDHAQGEPSELALSAFDDLCQAIESKDSHAGCDAFMRLCEECEHYEDDGDDADRGPPSSEG